MIPHFPLLLLPLLFLRQSHWGLWCLSLTTPFPEKKCKLPSSCKRVGPSTWSPQGWEQTGQWLLSSLLRDRFSGFSWSVIYSGWIQSKAIKHPLWKNTDASILKTARVLRFPLHGWRATDKNDKKRYFLPEMIALCLDFLQRTFYWRETDNSYQLPAKLASFLLRSGTM